MTPVQQFIVAVVLALGTLVSVGLSLISYRQNKRRNESEIGLKDTEKQELLQNIDKSRTEDRITQERWWAEQFGIVRNALEEERESNEGLREENKRVILKLDRIESFMRNEHKQWDDKARSQIEALGGQIEEPPLLETNGRRSEDS